MKSDMSGNNVIDRSEFHFWIENSRSRDGIMELKDADEVSQTLYLMVKRIERIGQSLDEGRYSEVINQSARVSLQASAIGLPRTAKLAAEMGEAMMSGHKSQALDHLEKLDTIVAALATDYSKEQ